MCTDMTHKSKHPFGSDFISTLFKTVPLNKGNYYVNIGLGTPPKFYPVIIDTDSSFSWVQCQPCWHCNGSDLPNFDPSTSSTYKKLPCSTTECNLLGEAIPDGRDCTCPSECKYNAGYVDESFSVGYLSRDSLTLTQSETLPGFVYGCGQDNENRMDFFGESAGLVGMARNKLSMISQLSAKYGQDFSYCLPTARRGSVGSLSIGKDSLMGTSYKFTPLLTNSKDSSFYGLNLTAIVVAGRTLGVDYNKDPAIIDSGTVVTSLPTSVYAILREEFRSIMSSKNKTILTTSPSDFLDTCYKGSLKEMSSDVPEFRMVFQGEAELTLAPQNVLVEGNEEGTLCLAFADYSDNGGTTIIGNIQLQTYIVAYDVSNSRIGFAAGGCS
ncbi:aspartyl protease family protein At5g10770-like [Cornus florida]|uniref:aspartyl protease family protein At5g10770-like n=1 Tax=Cornus florida TaxID=4283 RepID=UPI0028A129BA|nr:aspartyl protease family protein At5g10770-like [Cornus florida]